MRALLLGPKGLEFGSCGLFAASSGLEQNGMAKKSAKTKTVADSLDEIRKIVLRSEKAITLLMDVPQPLVVPISTFAPEPYEIVRPIFAVVEPIIPDDPDDDCTYLARFIEGRVGATGDTVEEAIECLKESLISKLNLLENLPRLGKPLRRQLHVLQDVMQRCPEEVETR